MQCFKSFWSCLSNRFVVLSKIYDLISSFCLSCYLYKTTSGLFSSDEDECSVDNGGCTHLSVNKPLKYTQTIIFHFFQTRMNVLLIMVVAVIYASTLNSPTNVNVEMDINCTQMEYLVLVRNLFILFFSCPKGPSNFSVKLSYQ